MTEQEPYRKPSQLGRVSNSFSKEELEVLAFALQRVETFLSLQGGLIRDEYEILAKIIQVALRGGDLSGIVCSKVSRLALSKLEGLRTWAPAEPATPELNGEAKATVTDRVTKMLARARLQDVVQASQTEAP